MKLCTRLLAIAIIVCSGSLISCAGPSSFSYQNVTLSLTHSTICNGCFTGSFSYILNPAGAGGITGAIEMPPGGGSGGCDQLFVTVTNAPLKPTWTIYPAPSSAAPAPSSGTTNPPGEPNPNTGTIVVGTGNSNFYCEPSGIPIYTGVSLVNAKAAGIVDANGNVVQGSTEVIVTNPADPNDPTKIVSAALFFSYQLQTPPTGVLVGMSGLTLPANVTVPLGGTYQFSGYVAGANGFNPCTGGGGAGPSTGTPGYAVTYSVNGVVGGTGTGAGQFGTISANGLYTAPTNYPSSTVKSAPVTVSSTACPTIISPAVTVLFP
jgi:hypothetical protein